MTTWREACGLSYLCQCQTKTFRRRGLGLALKGRVTSPDRTERELQEEGMPHAKTLR